MVAIGQADVLHLGPDLDHQGRALDLQVLDYRDGVAVLQDIAVGVLDHAGFLGRRLSVGRPLVRALRADEVATVLIGELGFALRARGQGGHE